MSTEKSNHEQANDIINENINAYNKIQEEVDKRLETCDDVKDGIVTKEEIKNEPGELLFRKITDTAMEILLNDQFKEFVVSLITHGVPKEMIDTTIHSFIFTTSFTAYKSVLFYDEMLKSELDKQFNNIGEFINGMSSDMNGIKAACEVYKTKIGELENQIKLLQLSKNV